MSSANGKRRWVVVGKCSGWLLFAVGVIVLGVGVVNSQAMFDVPPWAPLLIIVGGGLAVVGPTVAYLAERFWSGPRGGR